MKPTDPEVFELIGLCLLFVGTMLTLINPAECESIEDADEQEYVRSCCKEKADD